MKRFIGIMMAVFICFSFIKMGRVNAEDYNIADKFLIGNGIFESKIYNFKTECYLGEECAVKDLGISFKVLKNGSYSYTIYSYGNLFFKEKFYLPSYSIIFYDANDKIIYETKLEKAALRVWEKHIYEDYSIYEGKGLPYTAYYSDENKMYYVIKNNEEKYIYKIDIFCMGISNEEKDINNPIYGDFNFDREVNASDAALILIYAAVHGAGSFNGTFEEYIAQN